MTEKIMTERLEGRTIEDIAKFGSGFAESTYRALAHELLAAQVEIAQLDRECKEAAGFVAESGEANIGLRADVERLTRERDEAVKACSEEHPEMARLRSLLARRTEALRRHGTHDNSCHLRLRMVHLSNLCTCGLSAALRDEP